MKDVMVLADLAPLFPWVHVFVLCLGCIVGSFLNVVVWRVPRGESLLHPPSHCPNCGHAIRAWENIPVLSWLLLRGRCSGCQQPISIRYPLGELATGLVYVAVYQAACLRNLPVACLPGNFFLLGALISIFQIDVRHRLIPNVVTVTGMVVALLLALLLPASHVLPAEAGGVTFLLRLVLFHLGEAGQRIAETPLLLATADCVLGWLLALVVLGLFAWLGSVLARRSTKKTSVVMGWGDVKCLMMLGAFLGGDACIYILCAASSAGFVYGVTRLALSRGREGWSLPFGPFLAVSAFVWLLVGRCWQ